MNQGFPKAHRLLKRQEFTGVYATGTPYRNTGFHLFVRKREDCESTRIGLTVTRAVGPSVTRNRLRRWTRETFRLSQDKVKPGFDIVLNYHRSLAARSRQDFDRLFKNILSKAELLQD